MNDQDDFDLNIENYGYEDILYLFKLDYNFNEENMKMAKKMVIQMHPDKSNMDKKYFYFLVQL